MIEFFEYLNTCGWLAFIIGYITGCIFSLIQFILLRKD